MKRQIGIGTLVLASLTAHAGSPVIAERGSKQLDSGESLVSANGITLAYQSHGRADRQAILLIMGVGGQLIQWPNELPALLVKRGYRVITFDNRDAGLSTKFDSSGLPDWPAIFAALGAGRSPHVAYALDDMARDTVALLDALGIKQAHIAGVSMGGMIAQIVATNHPERTLSLTSIMAGAGNPAVPMVAKPEVMGKVPPVPPADDLDAVRARELALWRALAGPGYPEDDAAMLRRIDRSLARAYYPAGLERQGAAVVTAGDRRNRLRLVRVPTVVLHGAEDPLVPVDASRDVAASVPGAALRVIPGMGHTLPDPLVPVIADAIVSAATRARHAPRTGSPR